MLNTLNNMMVNKIVAASAKLKETATADESLPIIAVVDKKEKYTLGLTETPNEEVTEGLKGVLSGNFWYGLGQLICGGIKVFLGDRREGQSETTAAYHIVYANNTLLRIDYMMYKYTFSSTGIMSKYENAFCFLLQIGVLDMTKVNSQVLLFELTKTIGNENLEAIAHELCQIALFANIVCNTSDDLSESAFRGTTRNPNTTSDTMTAAGELGHLALFVKSLYNIIYHLNEAAEKYNTKELQATPPPKPDKNLKHQGDQQEGYSSIVRGTKTNIMEQGLKRFPPLQTQTQINE